jgi:predicted nucleotide-binding protein
MGENSQIDLSELVSEGQSLLEGSDPVRTDSEYQYWLHKVIQWLSDKYPETGVASEWAGLGAPKLVIGGSYYDYPEHWTHFRNLVSSRLRWLGITVNKLNFQKTDSVKPERQPTDIKSKKVFVVHGHDEALRETTARFIEKLDLEPVILHEQPNKGLTLIEKFESNSMVGFAVVLLSGDDIGSKKTDDKSQMSLRARQNVIFELGYFIGKLGRNKVCAIYQEGVDLPSDYSGVVYIPFDSSGAWKLKLAKELKESGIVLDLNKAI